MTLTEQLRSTPGWVDGAAGGLMAKAADELDRQRSQIIRLAGLLQDARDGLESLGDDLCDEEQAYLEEQLAEIDDLLAEVQP